MKASISNAGLSSDGINVACTLCRWVWWLVPMPFSAAIFIYDEVNTSHTHIHTHSTPRCCCCCWLVLAVVLTDRHTLTHTHSHTSILIISLQLTTFTDRSRWTQLHWVLMLLYDLTVTRSKDLIRWIIYHHSLPLHTSSPSRFLWKTCRQRRNQKIYFGEA